MTDSIFAYTIFYTKLGVSYTNLYQNMPDAINLTIDPMASTP